MKPSKEDILKLIDEFKETVNKRFYINERIPLENNGVIRDLAIRQLKNILEYENILKEKMKLWGIL